MAISGPTEGDLLESMRKVRAYNNDLWMNLVKIALRAEPKNAKAIIKAIQVNDSAISEIWKELAKDDRAD